MFSSLRNFLSRHRRKFIVTGVIFGGVYFLTNYAQRKLRDWQEREAKKFFEMTRKRQHFESTEKTCNQTILSLSKIISESITKMLNTEEIVLKLQENPDNKLELWEQMKIMIFTRICVLVYAFSILQLTLRVQLNIIGGYLYKDTVQENEPVINSNIQAKYLSLCHHFISDGVEELVKQIEKVVHKVVTPVSLKKKVTIQEIEQMFWSIQTILCTDSNDGDPVKKMAHYLLGHVELPKGVLDTMVKETMDILESEEVTSLTTSTISHCFSTVVDEIANIYSSKKTVTKTDLEVGDNHVVTNGALKLNSTAEPYVNINKIELHLVRVLPLINDLITKNMTKESTSIPDLLTQHLIQNDKLKTLGANIYESFSSD